MTDKKPLEWIQLPDGSQFAEGVHNGKKGAFWITYDPTGGDKPWVSSFKPDRIQTTVQKDVTFDKVPEVGDALTVMTEDGVSKAIVTKVDVENMSVTAEVDMESDDGGS